MTTQAHPSSLLLSAAEVSDLVSKDPKTVILDATWFMPGVERDPRTEFEQHHLAGAQWWDVDGVAAKHELNLPHMLPDATTFARACERHGIERDSSVVVYDGHGLLSAPRTLFTFKAFDHPRAYVLNGGLPRWRAEGRPLESGPAALPKPSTYDLDAAAVSPQKHIRSYEEYVASSDAGADLLLDSRPAPRFHGTVPEPRPWLSSGHAPNAVSLPFSTLLTPTSPNDPSAYQTLLPHDQLRKVIADAAGGEAGLERVLSGERKVITSCGSGMTAAVVWLALHELGAQDVALYDESWMGYAGRKESKIIRS